MKILCRMKFSRNIYFKKFREFFTKNVKMIQVLLKGGRAQTESFVASLKEEEKKGYEVAT